MVFIISLDFKFLVLRRQRMTFKCVLSLTPLLHSHRLSSQVIVLVFKGEFVELEQVISHVVEVLS